jgi:hypothetical protein
MSLSYTRRKRRGILSIYATSDAVIEEFFLLNQLTLYLNT